MWYQTAFRRMVVDMHIPDWDERFLSEYDPVNFVEMLKIAQAQSVVLYAHSHTGLFNYPTRVGVQHRGLKGRDIFGETLELCHQNGIAVVAYCSLIFDRWASDHHPEWRIKTVEGKDADETWRHGLVCPNSPYREYAAAWAEELLTRYAVDGIRYDMTFWPAVCYCPYCRQRFADEVGGEIPAVIDWEERRWVAFQRKREQWLAEFAGRMTATARRARPEASVEHQASTFSLDWRFGLSDLMAPNNDFLQGDFYGDALQGSFVRKLLTNLSPNLPYGFETSISVFLTYHTNTKSKELVQAKASAAVADQGSMIFIDAIDPLGTLNRRTYERIGAALAETRRYDACRGGELVQDVGVYFSFYSKYNPADSGKSPADPALASRCPHMEAVLGACQALIANHIPYGVVTRRSLGQLSQHRLLILPDVLMMDDEEAAAIRQYVADGGCLYVSKGAALVTADGVRQPDFLLSDVFGVHYRGETAENFTYIAPAPGFEGILPECSLKYPLALDESQVVVEAVQDAQALATIVLPYSHPADLDHFSSIHSNPPGRPTGHPALVYHRCGKGQVIYAAASLESAEFSRPVFIHLLKHFGLPFSFEVEAPGCVEMTLFHQAEKQRYIISLLNFQKELPNIPVEGIKVSLRLEGKTPQQLRLCPEGQALDYEWKDGQIEFTAPRLETLRVFELSYSRLANKDLQPSE